MTTTNTALAIIPRTIDEVSDLAERLSKSTLLPKAMQGKMPDVLVTIMAGQEMGLSPMASLRAIHVIEGKPVLSADGMVAIILGSGKAKYFTRVEESDAAVTYETCRVGTDTPRRCTWTIEMAKRAGLHLKDNWRTQPRAMLSARAKSELARDVYPDVLMGCYAHEEIEAATPATVHASAIEVVDAEIVNDTASDIEAASTVDELKALAPDLAKLKGEARKAARALYDAKMNSLRAGEAPVTNGVNHEATT